MQSARHNNSVHDYDPIMCVNPQAPNLMTNSTARSFKGKRLFEKLIIEMMNSHIR